MEVAIPVNYDSLYPPICICSLVAAFSPVTSILWCICEELLIFSICSVFLLCEDRSDHFRVPSILNRKLEAIIPILKTKLEYQKRAAVEGGPCFSIGYPDFSISWLNLHELEQMDYNVLYSTENSTEDSAKPKWEKNLEKNEYTFNWITMLYTWN